MIWVGCQKFMFEQHLLPRLHHELLQLPKFREAYGFNELDTGIKFRTFELMKQQEQAM
jgi:hypothetical protein